MVAFTMFSLFWNQPEFCLVPKLEKNCKQNHISLNKNRDLLLSVYLLLLSIIFVEKENSTHTLWQMMTSSLDMNLETFSRK